MTEKIPGQIKLKKIDCVLVPVDNLLYAEIFYTHALGLQKIWSDKTSVGMRLPETDAEVVLTTQSGLLGGFGMVNYLVDDARECVREWHRADRKVIVQPFEIAVGWCAVLADGFGNEIAILDLTKGPRV